MQTKEQTLEFPLDGFPKEWIQIMNPFFKRVFSQNVYEFAYEMLNEAPSEFLYWLYRALEVETKGDNEILLKFKQKYPSNYLPMDVSLSKTFWLIRLIKNTYRDYPFKELPPQWQNDVLETYLNKQTTYCRLRDLPYKPKDPFNPDFPYLAIVHYLKEFHATNPNRDEILNEFYHKYPKGIKKTYMDIVKYIPVLCSNASNYTPPVIKPTLYPINDMKEEWAEAIKKEYTRSFNNNCFEAFVLDMNASDPEFCLNVIYYCFCSSLSRDPGALEKIKEFSKKYLPVPSYNSPLSKFFYRILKLLGIRPLMYPLYEIPLEWAQMVMAKGVVVHNEENICRYRKNYNCIDGIEFAFSDILFFFFNQSVRNKLTETFSKKYPRLREYFIKRGNI